MPIRMGSVIAFRDVILRRIDSFRSLPPGEREQK